MSTISVIIPAYNAERTILETIESVLQQTFSDFELIVINDGSIDRTLELVGTVKDFRVKVLSYPNGGVSVARNRGIAHAKGNFIAFLDADDLWTTDKLELQLSALQLHPDAGVAYSWTHYMDEQGKYFHTGESITFKDNVYANLLVTNFLGSGSNPLIRRQALESIGNFDPTLTHAEEWEFYLRLAARWPFVVVSKAQILYRKTSNSASSKIEVMEKESLRVIDNIFQSVPLELQFLKNQSLANLYRFIAHLHLTYISSTGQAKQASKKLQMAICLQPRVLLDKKTQFLLIKLLLVQLISPKVAGYLFRILSKIRAAPV
ncbi:MAG: glycosyltransferase [Chroococcidiopsidaceae cyanobacterium CP_BM_ER_R8_30]|nr:glycosyltransferase [Chroococcidiopsidaceae cyanobacterium CP_BM_ER_R8_30]